MSMFSVLPVSAAFGLPESWPVAVLKLADPEPSQAADDPSDDTHSDLQTALPAIASQFEKETGQQVRLTFGSSVRVGV